MILIASSLLYLISLYYCTSSSPLGILLYAYPPLSFWYNNIPFALLGTLIGLILVVLERSPIAFAVILLQNGLFLGGGLRTSLWKSH